MAQNINGTNGNDVLNGGFGFCDDTINGFAGDDILNGLLGDDVLNGNAGQRYP